MSSSIGSNNVQSGNNASSFDSAVRQKMFSWTPRMPYRRMEWQTFDLKDAYAESPPQNSTWI
jgi:hypothetical protein